MPEYRRQWIKYRNPWLVGYVEGRKGKIAGIMLHSTRSGKCGNPFEGVNTEGWFGNPSNDSRYMSFADATFYNDGTQIQCTEPDKNEFAMWTAGYGEPGSWAAAHNFIQWELPQACVDDEFDDPVIDSAAQWAAELAHKYDFPLVRLPFLTQKEWPVPRGISSHDACMNGRIYGKSDVGYKFPWARFLKLANDYYNGIKDGDPMTPTELAQFNDYKVKVDRLERLVAGNGISTEGGRNVDKTGNDALEYADKRGWSALFGVGLARLQADEARVLALQLGATTGVPAHQHESNVGDVIDNSNR